MSKNVITDQKNIIKGESLNCKLQGTRDFSSYRPRCDPCHRPIAYGINGIAIPAFLIFLIIKNETQPKKACWSISGICSAP